MVRVDQVDVAQIRRGRLVGDVDGMLQRQVPDRKGLILRVARAMAELVLVVELVEARGELAAAGAGADDDDDGPFGLHELVSPAPLGAERVVDVGEKILDHAMGLDFDAEVAQLVGEAGGDLHRGIEARHHDRADQKPPFADLVDETEHLVVVGRARVGAMLPVLDVPGIDADDEFDAVLELLEHADLDVGIESGQHTRRVQILEELAAHFDVELAEALRPADDLRALLLDVQRVVESTPDFIAHKAPAVPGPAACGGTFSKNAVEW